MAEDIKYCRKCGNPNKKEAKFCSGCGTPFLVKEAAPETEEKLKAEPKAKSKAVSEATPKTETPKKAAPKKAAPKKPAQKKETQKKDAPKKSGGCLKTVVLAAAAVAALFFIKDKFGRVDPPRPSVSVTTPKEPKTEKPKVDSWEYTKAQYEQAPVYTSAISSETPIAQCGDVRVEMEAWMLEEEDEIKVVELPELIGEASGNTLKRYDISLASGTHEFGTDVAVCIPRDENEHYYYAYYNPETKEHERLFFEPSEDGMYDKVYISHFSGVDKIPTDGLSEEAAGVVTDGEGGLRGSLFSVDKASSQNAGLWKVRIDDEQLFAGYVNYANPELYKMLISNVKGELPQTYSNDATIAESFAGHGGAAIGAASLFGESKVLDSMGERFSVLGLACTFVKYVDAVLESEAGGNVTFDDGTVVMDGAGTLVSLGSLAFGSTWAATPLTVASLALYLAGNKPELVWTYKEEMALGTLAFSYGPLYQYPADRILLRLSERGLVDYSRSLPDCRLYLDGRGWAQLLDVFYQECEKDPDRLSRCIYEACEIYAMSAVGMNESDKYEMIQKYLNIHNPANPALYTEPMSEREMIDAVKKIRDYMVYKLRPIIKAKIEQYNRADLLLLRQELDSTLIPRLNALVYMDVASDAGGAALKNDPYIRELMSYQSGGVAGQTLDLGSGLIGRPLDIVWGGKPVFLPNNAYAAEYQWQENSYSPEIPNSGNTVFTCTLYHYLLMGHPEKLRFNAVQNPSTQEVILPAKELTMQELAQDEKGNYHVNFKLEDSGTIFGSWNGNWPFFTGDSYYLTNVTLTIEDDGDGDFRLEITGVIDGKERSEKAYLYEEVCTLSPDKKTLRAEEDGDVLTFTITGTDRMQIKMRTEAINKDLDFTRVADTSYLYELP